MPNNSKHKSDSTTSEDATKISQLNKELKRQLKKQKKSEAAIRERIEQIENLLYSLPVGIIIVESETYTIVDANPQAMLMIGKSKEQIVGSNYNSFFSSSDQGNGFPINAEQSEYLLLTATGAYLPVHKTKILEIIDGREHFIECFADISERKRTEQERIRKEKLQGIIEMSGAICHELNQPMQAVSGYAELLLMEVSEDEPIYKALNTIKNQVDKMADITNKLMRITSYETKEYASGSKIVDVEKSSSAIN